MPTSSSPVRTLCALVLLLLAACGDDPSAPATPPRAPIVDLGAAPSPIELVGAAGVVTPPAGSWRSASGTQGTEHSFLQYLSPDESILLRVAVFPAQEGQEPLSAVMTAADSFFRSLGVDGFGMPARERRRVLGAAAADGDVFAALGGQKIGGSARILRTGPATWAFAVGFAPADAPAAQRDLVRRFTRSLRPSTPRFYERVFSEPGRLEEVAFRIGEEPPILNADLEAIAALLQAGAGFQFPLAARTALLDILRTEVGGNTPEGRAAYRQARAAFAKWVDLPAEERATGMAAIGKRMLTGMFDAAKEQRPAALRFARLLRRLGGVAVGTTEDGLSVGDLAALGEMSAFLASVAADREIRLDGEEGVALRESLKEALTGRWPTLSEEEKAALRAGHSTWAHLRRAFDLAEAADKAVFRRAVAAELAPEAEREKVSALDPGADLMVWMHDRDHDGLEIELVTRAFGLSPAARAELIGLLAVPERSYPLGW